MQTHVGVVIDYADTRRHGHWLCGKDVGVIINGVNGFINYTDIVSLIDGIFWRLKRLKLLFYAASLRGSDKMLKGVKNLVTLTL